MLQKTLSIATVLFLCLQCGKSPNVTKGQNMLGVVNFPEWFLSKSSTPRGEDIVIATGRYEVRKAPNSSPGELLFEAVDNDGTSSVNFFAASLDGQFNVRAASAEEWARAESIPSTRRDPYSQEVKATVTGALYRGKTYAKTGQSFEHTAALPSPGGKWIVVFSHTSEKDHPSYGVMGGGGRGKGEMFIDVYATSSGEKILSGHGRHAGGSGPSEDFDNAFWVGERYLIVPMATQISRPNGGQDCFLGILPVSKQ